jgi:hypothetical protein
MRDIMNPHQYRSSASVASNHVMECIGMIRPAIALKCSMLIALAVVKVMPAGSTFGEKTIPKREDKPEFYCPL